METQAAPAPASLNWWERLIRVASPDPEIERQGRIFNGLMVVSTGLVLYLAASFLVGYLLGYLDATTAAIAAAFPLAFVPISLGCIALVKRGHLRQVVPAYVWATFVGIATATYVFDGPVSSAWVLFIWMVTVGGILIAPRYALLMTGLVVGYYGLLLGASQLGLYAPPILTTTQSRTFFTFAFILGVLITTGGLLTYLNMRSLNAAFSNLTAMQQQLELSRQQLEQRVADRTEVLQRRTAQFSAIVAVGQGIAGLTDLGVLLQTAADLICQHFATTHVGIYLVDDVRASLRLRATAGGVGSQRFMERAHLLLAEPGMVQSVVNTGRLRLAATPMELARWAGPPEWPVIQAELALPLVSGGAVIGVLDLLSVEAGTFDQEAREALVLMANNLASALENTRLLTDMRESLSRLEKYQEEDVVRGWRTALARRNRRVDYAYDRLMIQPGLSEDLEQLVESHPPAGVETLEYDGAYWLMAPLRVQQRLLGTLAFESPRPWTEDQQRLAATVVDQLGLALENARLLEDTRLSAQRERARGEIVGRVRGSVQIDAVLRSAVEELGRALQVDRARIQLLPPSGSGRANPKVGG